jgi:hypothetical protein
MKEGIAIAGVLALTIALAIAVAGRIGSQPKTASPPSESAISKVIQTFNAEQGKHWRRRGGDLETGHIDLGDYFNGYLATMDVRPRDTDGFLYTADISARNSLTRRATPFAKSRNGHVCLDFQSTGEVIKRERDFATYDC